jgi:hypothetical protein
MLDDPGQLRRLGLTRQQVQHRLAEGDALPRGEGGILPAIPVADLAARNPDVEPPAETAARTRQATVDRARAVSGLLRDVDEFLTNGASDAALAVRIRSRSEVAGTPPELRDALLGPLREVEVENAIRAAYRQIVDDGGGGFGGFVGIADLRDAVGDGIPRDELDANLKRMARGNSPAVQGDGFRLIPIANQKALTDRDREAAIRQGGENLNAVSFADPSPREPDRTRLRQILDSAASDAGLRPIEAAGTRTTFDPARHEALDGKIPAGTPVVVTRQGYVTNVDGDEVVLDKAVVMRDDLPDTSRSTIPDADDEAAWDEIARAAGHDTTLGHDELHHWWVFGEGRARWKTWTELRDQLLEHVSPEKAATFASAWFHERYGYWSGSDLNRVKHGKPPRGNKVGPG